MTTISMDVNFYKCQFLHIECKETVFQRMVWNHKKYITGLCTLFLTQNSWNPCNLLDDKATWRTLPSLIWTLTPVPNTELLNPSEFPGWQETSVIMRQLLEGSWRAAWWGLITERASHSEKLGTLSPTPPPLGRGERAEIQSMIVPPQWSPHKNPQSLSLVRFQLCWSHPCGQRQVHSSSPGTQASVLKTFQTSPHLSLPSWSSASFITPFIT